MKFGRKLKLTLHQRREALARREAGESLVETGRSYNVSHSTISRLHEVTSFLGRLGELCLQDLKGGGDLLMALLLRNHL